MGDIFTEKSIRRGKRIFASKPYSFGVGGITVENTRAICHLIHCLSKVRSATPVVCRDCNVIGYCSKECSTAARALHNLECKGIAELERLRRKGGADT